MQLDPLQLDVEQTATPPALQPFEPAIVVSWPEPPARVSPAESTAPSEPTARGADAPGSWSTLWLTDRDVRVFALLAAAVLMVAGWRWAELSHFGSEPIEIEHLGPVQYDGRLDLNTATWVELAQLEGLGETLGRRIVDDRTTRGNYATVDELDRVKGIGLKTIERLRPHVVIRE